MTAESRVGSHDRHGTFKAHLFPYPTLGHNGLRRGDGRHPPAVLSSKVDEVIVRNVKERGWSFAEVPDLRSPKL